MTRILIIEDEVIIARFIEQQLLKHFECSIQLAINIKEAKAVMDAFSPQILLCDINLNEAKSGIELITELQQRYAFEVVYITSYKSLSIIREAAQTNPANYIIKPVDEGQLFAGVQLVINKLKTNKGQEEKKLQTKRILNEIEYKIVQLIRQKKTTNEIAQLLHLSPYTVKNHRHNICGKLGLENKNNALLQWVLEQPDLS